MLPIFFAYGEGQFATTATGIASGLLALLTLLILFGVYASKTYPGDSQGSPKNSRPIARKRNRN